MTKIYLIRHAEAEGNMFRRAHGQFNGQIIGRGPMQIERLRKRFENEKIDAVYSSDLARTCVTAEAIYKQHSLPLNTDARLREVNMGVWEDVAWGDMEYNEPEMSWYFSNDPAKWHIGGSEDYADVRKRMTACISDIAASHDGGSAAVFSHGFAIRIFLCSLLGVESHEISKVPYCDNTAVTLLHCENGEFSIEYRGDNSHLSHELSTFAHQTWWRKESEYVRENLRYMQFDEVRDATIEAQCRDELGERYQVGEAYTAFLSEEPVGLLGVDYDAVSGGDRDVSSSRDSDNCNDCGGGRDSVEAGWLGYIYIKPELRRRNYGVQLLGQSVALFRRLGREVMRCVVDRDAPAYDFCLKYGFSVVGESGAGRLMEKNIKNWD